MAWRFRAHLRFTPESGMAPWGRDQLAERIAQAFDVHAGAPNVEHSYANVLGSTVEVLDINAFWPDDRRDLADDTIATLLTVTADDYLAPDEDGDRSWMDLHACAHEQVPPQPCAPPEWTWTRPEPTVITAWVQPTGAHDAYPLGARVTHKGRTWESTVDANVWEPGIFGWARV